MKKAFLAVLATAVFVAMAVPVFAGGLMPQNVASSAHYDSPIAQTGASNVSSDELADKIVALKEATERTAKLLGEKLLEVNKMAEKAAYQKGVEALSAGDGKKAIDYFETYEVYLKVRKAKDSSAGYLLLKKAANVIAASQYSVEAESLIAKGKFDYAKTSLAMVEICLRHAEAISTGEKTEPKNIAKK